MVLYIVCNADSTAGLGHLMRCLSLASQLKALEQSICFVGCFSDTARDFIKNLKFDYYNAKTNNIATVLQLLPSDAGVILDSYDYDAEDLLTGQYYVLIDDFFKLSHYPVLGVINFTINAAKYNYENQGALSQALGLGYFLPHPRLNSCHRDFNTKTKKILVLIGSGDPFELTPQLIEAFNSFESRFVIRVLTANPINVKSKHELEIYPLQQDINPSFQWADCLITSGGLAKYEAAYVHKPAIVFSQNEGEFSDTRDFAEATLCFDFGLAEFFDKIVFVEMFKNWLANAELRKLAFEKSHLQFKADSAFRAACYVQACFSSAGCEGVHCE
jgi:spore coat polysaccharide biosynthesis predicted glycosyltransferase SpsG